MPAAAAHGQVKGTGKPPVTSAGLISTLTRSALKAHGRQLMKFAAVDAGKPPNRGFGGPGHRLTVEYIRKQLNPAHYRIEVQEFVELYSTGSSDFAAGRKGEKQQIYPSSFFTYGPSANVTAPIVKVADVGCKAVQSPSSAPLQRREGIADCIAGRLPAPSQGPHRPDPPRHL